MVAKVFNVDGISQLETITTRIEAAPVKLMAATNKWMASWGPTIATALMKEAPVNKNKWDPVAMAHAGRLRDSIRFEANTGPTMSIMQFTTNVPYAPYVLDGTQPHDIFPVNMNALHWVGPYGDAFSQGVHHPGTAANKFGERVWNTVEVELVRSYNAILGSLFNE